MKILTKNKLSEMLKKVYMISCFETIHQNKEKKAFFIVYPFFMVRMQYFVSNGWSFTIYGESTYTISKEFVRLCDLLDTCKYKAQEKKQNETI